MKTTVDFSALAAVALLSRYNWLNISTESIKGETSKFCATGISIRKDGYLEFKRQFTTTKYTGAIEKVIPISQSKFLLQDTRGTVFTVEATNKAFADRNTASGSKDDPASLIDWSRSHIDEAGNPVVVLDLRKLGNISSAMDHRIRFYINVYMGGYANQYQVNRTIHFQQIGSEIYAGAYTGPRAPSARSISPTLPERSPTIPRAVLEERPCQPRRRAEPGISHRSRGWGCRWQSKQSPVIECDSGKSVIPPAWHRRFPRIPVPLHAGSSNPIQGHRGNRRD